MSNNFNTGEAVLYWLLMLSLAVATLAGFTVAKYILLIIDLIFFVDVVVDHIILKKEIEEMTSNRK